MHIVSYDDFVVIQVDTFLSFQLWTKANRICCFALNDVAEDLFRYWILQQILPLFLLFNGTSEFLHGMAVSKHPHHLEQSPASPACIAILGESYAGKSTLLSYYLGQGHALVTDDHLALSRTDYTKVLPSIPFYRPYRAPEDLGLPAKIYSAAPTRLECIYLLQPAPPDAAPQVDMLQGLEAIQALFPSLNYSIHSSKKPNLFPLVEDRFRGLADIVRRVPIARLHVPRSLARLPEVYHFIQKDLAGQPR